MSPATVKIDVLPAVFGHSVAPVALPLPLLDNTVQNPIGQIEAQDRGEFSTNRSHGFIKCTDTSNQSLCSFPDDLNSNRTAFSSIVLKN